MIQTSGIDVSHHQRPPINWEQVFQSGQRFAFIRASFVGTQSKKPNSDRNFEKHWDSARAVNGLLLGVYHFFVPVPDVKEQLDFFLNLVGDRKLDLPLVLDFENSGGLDKEKVSSAIEEGLILLEKKVGYRPIIYTGPNWWNRNTVGSSRWSKYDLWIANYGNPTPLLPRDWTNWRFWQWTGTGTTLGVSGEVDINWFKGDENQLKQYGVSSMNPPPVTPLLKYSIEAISSVNVRKGPSTNHAVIGNLQMGEQFEVLDLAGNDIWLEIGSNRWAAFMTGSQQLCTFKIGTPPQIVVSRQINIRSGPSKTMADVGDLTAGTVLNVSNLGGTDIWVKIGTERWVAFAKDSRRFLKWVL